MRRGGGVKYDFFGFVSMFEPTHTIIITPNYVTKAYAFYVLLFFLVSNRVNEGNNSQNLMGFL